MNLKIDDISKIIKDQIKNYASKTQQDEIGYVIQVGDGIAKVHGLEKCKANELLRFENDSYGMALNLEESCVSVVMLGTDVGISEGSLVKRTGQVSAGQRYTKKKQFLNRIGIATWCIKYHDTLRSTFLQRNSINTYTSSSYTLGILIKIIIMQI